MAHPDPTRDQTPFSGLTPDAILDAIESLGLHADGRILALNSYENRVYRIGLEDAPPVVAKFYRPQRWTDAAILEEHGFTDELVEAGLPVITPQRIHGATLHRHDGWRFTLFPLQGGHAPEAGDPDTLRQLGRSIARLHAVGRRHRFRHRTRLDPHSHGHAAMAVLNAGDWIPSELRANIATLGRVLLQRIESDWDAAPATTLRLHGDLHPGNLLWRDERVHLVDFDDCLGGPAIQDMWMLFSGPRDEQEAQLGWLLEGYVQFDDFDPGELRLVESLRALRLLHHNAWLAQRWHDPAFPAAFPWFGERRYWESLIRQMQEQLSAFDEPPLQWHS